jgi:DNA-binding NarL/FixJ family response regulator
MPDLTAFIAQIEFPPQVPALSEASLGRLAVLAASLGISPDAALGRLLDQQEAAGKRDLSTVDELSPKQTAVLEFLWAGHSVKETATLLGIAEETVRTHIIRICGRLDCLDLLALRFQ